MKLKKFSQSANKSLTQLNFFQMQFNKMLKHISILDSNAKKRKATK